MINQQGKLTAISEVAKALTQPFELPELLDAVLHCITCVVDPAEAGLVLLWDTSGGMLRPIAATGYDTEGINALGIWPGESVIGSVFDTGELRLICEAEQVAQEFQALNPSNRETFRRAQIFVGTPCCILAAPISVSCKKLGVLVLETIASRDPFDTDDLPLIKTIADLIALAIDRARLLELEESLRSERQTEKMRSELLGILSHELRIPLTSIRGYSSALLLDEIEWSEEKRKEFLRLIDEECTHMQGMLKEILDSSLIDADQLVVVPQPVRIPNIAREVAIELQRLTDIHKLLVDFPPNFPIVAADARWIKQVFRNIIDNAIKYSPSGGLIVVHGEVRQADVMVMVADQGIGISPEDMIPLFEKYFRVKSAATLHISGTGLGLPISRKIVEAHGGRIWAKSKAGEGTTVYFSLPLLATPKET